jgi:hypothetical protein
MMTTNSSLLKDKYSNVIESITRMMSNHTKFRPTCEQLLNDKSLWALDIKELKEDIIDEELSGLIITEQLIKENFCKCFIKTKCERN